MKYMMSTKNLAQLAVIKGSGERLLGFNQPLGPAIRRKLSAPLSSGAELYQIFVSAIVFEPDRY
ncbi:MAG: hypothetical protein LBG25_01375 [Spirochaetaceae bacterium]|jgi:hypothetical protein|nr:hypothetical protein [Spirochaetaceae bacterium]